MALIDWNDSLKLGIPTLDFQHRRLVDILNRLHEAMVSRQGNEVLVVILDDLVKYTIEHFTYEESVLKAHGYGDYAGHVGLHHELTHQVRDFRLKLKEGRIGLSATVLQFLTQWLTLHIGNEDRKYVAYLTEKGVR
jgi:hemerythrin-like metal-binding protein